MEDIAMNLRKTTSVLAAATAAALALPASPAKAAIPNTACNGHTYSYILMTFAGQRGHVPIRCGNSTWGFVHIVIVRGRTWDQAFQSNVSLTLARGEDNGHEAVLFDGQCNELFRVVYNQGAYNGTDQAANPQGIVTAYYSTYQAIATSPVSAPAATQFAVTASYRTDCYIIDPIGYNN